MKWPAHLIIIRHGQSVYNALRAQKEADPVYQQFRRAFSVNPEGPETVALARQVWEKFRLGVSDHNTPLSLEGETQARLTGAAIFASGLPRPDVVFVSPYVRTQETLRHMRAGGFDIGSAKVVAEDRIREQEHGLTTVYNDWRVFQTLHPEQRMLREAAGPYWYRYPQGESVSDVRDRIRSWQDTLVREYAGQVVYCVSHHLTKLSIRANLERLTPEQFIHIDEKEKPINCGITHYIGNPSSGRNGRPELAEYNLRLWDYPHQD